MATYTVSIGGSTREVTIEGFSIQETANGVDTLQCMARSLDGSYLPDIDDDFFFMENGTRIFGGKVEAAKMAGLNRQGNTAGLAFYLTAKSYSLIPQRRIITITLAVGTLKAQLTQLNTAEFATDFSTTIHASQANGPSMPEVAFDAVRGDAILNALMTTATALGATGYTWTIDENNKLRATSTGEIAAPFNVTDGDRNAIGDISVDSTRNDLYANRLFVTVISGSATSTETFVAANGVSSGGYTRFTAKYPASDSQDDAWTNELTFDGVNQGPILFGLPTPDYPTGLFAWGWDYTVSPAQLVFNESFTGWAFPFGAQVISITYAIKYPFTVTVEDAAGIAAYGHWDRSVTPPTALGLDELQDYADGILASLSPVKQEVLYSTLQMGIRPGMTQTVNSAKRQINETVLVQEVTTRMLTDRTSQRDVSAVVSSAFQGTFRGTVEQWMGGGSGGASQATPATGVSRTVPGNPVRSVQHNAGGVFAGDEFFLFSEDRSLSCGEDSTIDADDAQSCQAFGVDCHITDL